jgi:hypothetical protein
MAYTEPRPTSGYLLAPFARAGCREESMADSNTSKPVLVASTVVSTIVALVAIGWGYSQSQRVAQVTASLQAEQQQSAQLKASLEAATQQITQTQQQVAQLQKKDLPVTLNFRKALLGPGLVAMFKNNSSTPLEVAAELSSQSTGERRTVNLVIPANGIEQVGFQQGWPFAAGQHIVLENGAYRSLEFTVPQT